MDVWCLFELMSSWCLNLSCRRLGFWVGVFPLALNSRRLQHAAACEDCQSQIPAPRLVLVAGCVCLCAFFSSKLCLSAALHNFLDLRTSANKSLVRKWVCQVRASANFNTPNLPAGVYFPEVHVMYSYTKYSGHTAQSILVL